MFVEGEFIEDEIAGETPGGAGIGGEDFDASGVAVAVEPRVNSPANDDPSGL